MTTLNKNDRSKQNNDYMRIMSETQFRSSFKFQINKRVLLIIVREANLEFEN